MFLTYIQINAESWIQKLIITSEIRGMNTVHLQEYKLELMKFNTPSESSLKSYFLITLNKQINVKLWLVLLVNFKGSILMIFTILPYKYLYNLWSALFCNRHSMCLHSVPHYLV